LAAIGDFFSPFIGYLLIENLACVGKGFGRELINHAPFYPNPAYQ
jgi:hypothetical protein